MRNVNRKALVNLGVPVKGFILTMRNVNLVKNFAIFSAVFVLY